MYINNNFWPIIGLLWISLYFAKPLQISNNINAANAKDFKVYWNSPTFQCKSHKIYFDDLLQKYGILHNENVEFRGETIVILYDPGMFPALLTNGSSFYYRNGGLPQNGDINLHKKHFAESVAELIPDTNFSGIGIIDFESWRPIFRQNFGTLVPYKTKSIEEEKEKHPTWSDGALTKEASRRFESAGRKFMERTLTWIKESRPQATWGYYAYPYCYNMSPNNMKTDCSVEVKKENDRLSWLFNSSQNFYPSLYVGEKRLSLVEKLQLIGGRVAESKRLSRTFGSSKSILPYFWYKYQDTGNFLNEQDVQAMFRHLRELNVDGIVIWGSSNDVNTRTKCEQLYLYVDLILGPALNK